MIYVTSLIRYKPYGYIYKVDLSEQSVAKKIRVQSDQSIAKHGGPHGLARYEDLLVTGTYSDIRIYDSKLEEIHRFSHPYLSGVHGLSVHENRIWVSSCNNEVVLCFTPGGELLEEIFLEEDPDLMEMVGRSSINIDREWDFRNQRRPYESQPFHVNHVQERDDGLYLSLHKQGILYDFRSNQTVCSLDSNGIHDAQIHDGLTYINHTDENCVKVVSREGNEIGSIHVDIHRFLSYAGETRVKLHLLTHLFNNGMRWIPLLGHFMRDHKCHTNWLRGLKVLGPNTILVGGSPAALFVIETHEERIKEFLPLSWNPCEAVFGIESLSGEEEIHQESMRNS